MHAERRGHRRLRRGPRGLSAPGSGRAPATPVAARRHPQRPRVVQEVRPVAPPISTEAGEDPDPRRLRRRRRDNQQGEDHTSGPRSVRSPGPLHQGPSDDAPVLRPLRSKGQRRRTRRTPDAEAGRAVKPPRKLRPGRSAAYRAPMGRALEARSREWQRGGGIAGCQRRLAKRYVIEKSRLLSASRISAGVASSSSRHWPFVSSSGAGEFDGADPTWTSDLTTPQGALGAQQTDRSSASRVQRLERQGPSAARRPVDQVPTL